MTDVAIAQYYYIRSTKSAIRRTLLYIAYGSPLVALCTSALIALLWMFGFHFDFTLAHAFTQQMSKTFGYIQGSSQASRWPYLNAVVLSVDIVINLIAALALLLEIVFYSILLDFKNTKLSMRRYTNNRLQRKSRIKLFFGFSIVFLAAALSLIMEIHGDGILTSTWSFGVDSEGANMASLMTRPAESNMIMMIISSFMVSITPILYVAMIFRAPIVCYYILFD